MFLKTGFKIGFIFILAVLVHFGTKAQSWPTDTIHVQINTNDPQYPFPQFLEYSNGKSLAANNAVGVTHADMEKAMREAYQIMMHRALKVPGKVLNGVQYMQFNNSTVPQNYGTFVSEGDGYALLAAAYFADKPTFDGLWAWVHDNRLSKVNKYWDGTALRMAYTYGAGFAGWECTDADGVGSTNINSAGDGDVDIAMALLIASKQWPTGGITTYNGTVVTYKTEALKMITALVDTLYYSTSPFGAQAGVKGYLSGIVGIDGYIKSGNTWGEVTNWRYSAANTAYPWALAKPDPIQVNSPYVDYNAPAYFEEFATFLAANGGTAWQINQCKRCAGSGDWTIGQMYSKGYVASAGNYTVSDNGATTTFGSFSAGEDFRMGWRTILNYMWHGNPMTTWNAATHQLTAGGNTFEYDMALRHKEFLKFPNSLPSSSASAFCSKLGASPDPGQPSWKGVAQIKQQYAPNGSVLANYGVNWMVGTGMPAAVSSGDLDLIAELYRQCELSWDDQSGSAKVTPAAARYINSTPKYFHGWFRTLGMLTASGNLHAPVEMVATANMKVYMSVDKTFAYEGDIINYQVSYRNYGVINATGVSITTTIDPNYSVVSASNGGVISGNTITWNIGTVTGFKTNGLAATMGTRTFVVKVNTIAAAAVACLTSTITSSNAPSWTSNEYPNNASYTMERNCVDLLKDRVLAIQKTTDRSVMNSGDIVNFTLNFQNKSGSNLWLNGGRDRVILSYANYPTGVDFYQFYRVWHTAHEAYINLGNYRVSYFMNDAAAIGEYNAATNPTGWAALVTSQSDMDKYGYNPTTYPDGTPVPANKQMHFTYQRIPWGSDANGAWNQRIITQFADVLTAPSTHIFDKLDSEYLIHKGVVGPAFLRTQLESKPSSTLLPRLVDDWSYSTSVLNGDAQGQGQYFFPVTPSYTDATTAPRFSPVTVTNYSKDACGGPVQNFSKVLFEEFDGYTWRRVAGNGPLPGRETYNVTVTDSIPIQLAWNGFANAVAVGVTATYTALTGNPKFSGYVKWSIPVMLTGDSGQLTYSTIAKTPCAEQTFVNAGWIWSDVDSPDSSAVNLKLTCTKVPPTPPVETSLVKTADKTNVVVGDVVTYTLTYTNKDGSTASWKNTATVASDWQVVGTGTTMPDMNKAILSLSNNDNTSKAGTNGYAFGHKKSHGVNGYIDATFTTASKGIFSFFYRYTAGTPGQSDFMGVRLEIVPTNSNVINFNVYNNATLLTAITNVAYPGSITSIHIKTQLLNDKLYIWINDLTGAPLKVISGITNLNAGYAGISTLPGTIIEQSFTSYTTHFDSAFDLVLTDPVPTQLNTVTAISDAGALTGSTVTWPTIAGPILANAVTVRTFKATVNTCTDFITNIANATVYGISNIQSQYVVTCGAVTPPCTKPTITSLATGMVCSGIAQSYSIISSLPSTYIWSRAAIVGITNAAVTGQTAASITEILINTTTTSIDVVYLIIPTSTAQSCTGATFTYTVTVNPLPTITGTLTVCIGSSTTLTGSATPATAGTWSSATPAVATVSGTNSTSGVVSGVTAGTSIITYTNSNGCKVTATVTVNPLPTITGTLTACVGSTTQLTGSATAAAAPAWSSATPAVATVDNTGLVSGVTAGTSVITYTNSNGCKVTATVTINALPTITGTLNVCIGSTTQLTGSATAAAAPAWSSATPAVAAVDNTGLVSGVTAGTSIITYTNSNGCKVTATVTVNPLPTITGTLTVCIGSSTTLTGSATPATAGTWSSATPAVATVSGTNSTSGVVSGVTAGTSIITYTNSNGCKVTATVTVNPLPTITGTLTACVGSTTQLTGSATAAAAPAWSSATPAVATVDNTGLVTGVAAGTSIITYTNSNGCKVTATVTINALPTITGTLNVCIGSTTQLTGSATAAAAPAWSSATPAVATVDNTGLVSGVTAGTSIISYTNSNGCKVTATVTVNPKPAITSVTTGATCTGVSQNYLITSDIPSTYSWIRATVSGINESGTSGTSNPITEILTGAGTATYVITPTSTTGTCAGTAFIYTVTVGGSVAPTITLAVSSNPICDGSGVVFTATPSNEGPGPVYKWYVNGALAGVVGTTYLTSVLSDGDQVQVDLISNSSCASTPNASSNIITANIIQKVAPTIVVTADKSSICPSETVTFIAAVTNEGGGSDPAPLYKWYANGVLISGETNSTYQTTGSSLVNPITAELTTGLTCVTVKKVSSAPVSVTVTTVSTPSVTLSANATSICSGKPVTFTAVASNAGSTPSYQWYIGSSAQGTASTNNTFTTSSLTDPAGPPATPGSNEVHVAVTGSGGCSTGTVSSNPVMVTVNPGVLPGSISTGSSFCSGTTPGTITELTAASGITPSATYTWEQNTGTPINPANWVTATGTPTNGGKGFIPSGTATTDISYRRTVTDLTLPSACQFATTNAITYTVIALPVINSATSGTICSGSPQNYKITSAIPSSYVWSRNSVTGITPATGITGQITNPIIETLVNNTLSPIPVAYSIVPTSTSGSCVGATFTYTVTVNPLPNVQPPVESNLICSGVSHTYTITSDIAASYSWTRASVTNITPATGSGTTSSITETLTNQTIGTASPSDIVVYYVITPTSSAPASCAGPQFTYGLTVAVAAVPTVSVTANKTGICAGVPVKYTATGTATGNFPTYQWYQSSAANPAGVAVGTNSTTYTSTDLALSTDKVWVVMTSTFPCIAVGSANPVASAPVSIEVKQSPKPQIATDQVICSADGGFTYTATNLQANSTLQWQLNAQNIAKATEVSYNATQSGLYTVVEDNGYCTGASSASKLTIVPTPDAYAGSDMYVTEGTFVQLQAGGGITGTTYSWTPPTGLSSTTISNPSFKADNTITYKVTLTNTDAASGHTCSGESSVTITVVKPIVVPNVITVNGDGNNDTWHIQHIEGYPNATFEIYNRWGNLVWKSTGYPKEWDGTNFRNGEVLPDGTYFYIINLHSQIFTEPYTGWIQIVK